MKRQGRLPWIFGKALGAVVVFASMTFIESARCQEVEIAGPRRYGGLDAGEESYRIHDARRRALVGMQMGLNDAMNIPYTLPYGYGSGAWYLGLQEAWPSSPGAPVVARPNPLSSSGAYRSVQIGPNRYIYRLPDNQSPAVEELPAPPADRPGIQRPRPERPAPSGPREF